jgi:hypothetical protein
MAAGVEPTAEGISSTEVVPSRRFARMPPATGLTLAVPGAIRAAG